MGIGLITSDWATSALDAFWHYLIGFCSYRQNTWDLLKILFFLSMEFDIACAEPKLATNDSPLKQVNKAYTGRFNIYAR